MFRPVCVAIVALALSISILTGRAFPAPDPFAVEDGHRFAFDLYRHIAPPTGNVFFSPWNVRSTLGMVYAGARGRTQRDIALALRDRFGARDFQSTASQTDRAIRGTRGSELRTANAVWIARDIRLETEYGATLRSVYRSPPRPIDFGHASAARETVNRWAEKETGGHIRGLVPKVDPRTRHFLCGAIYFRGTWDKPFAKSETKEAPFHLTSSATVRVPFMHLGREFQYAEDPALQVIELPYQGDELAMLIFLPRRVDGLASLERTLDADSLAAWDGRLEHAPVDLALPRFQFEREYLLSAPLAAMGMRIAFQPGADFSGIARGKPLYVGEGYHKTFVLVDEHGTEAAAATGIGVLAAAAPRRPVSFTADHPFLFLIRHRATGTILFMGRLADPS